MEGTNKLPYYNACLTCLNTKPAESILVDTQWIKLIEFCTGLMVDLNSRTWKICSQCSEQIQSYAKFKQKCEKSDAFWKSILSGNSILQVGQHGATSADNVQIEYEIDTIKTEEPILNFDPVNNIVCQEETSYDDFKGNWFDNTPDEFMSPEFKPDILVPNNDVKVEFVNESIREIDAGPNTDETTFKCDPLIGSCRHTVKKYKTSKRNKVKFSSLPLRVTQRTEKQTTKQLPLLVTQRTEKQTTKQLPLLVTRRTKKQTTKQHYCGLCKMTSSSLEAINKHVLEEHSSKNDLNCKMCDYVGRDFAQMEVHRFSHRPEELKSNLVCHICGFSPPRRERQTQNFEFHYRKKHLNKKGGLCNLCNKSYETLNLWRLHEEWHSGVEYICDYCKQSFTLKFSLLKHIKARHLSIKAFVCEVCGTAFTRKETLDFHRQSKHTTTERVSCPHCLKSLKNKKYLYKHVLRLHMKHKHKFICEVCSRSYPSQKELNSHTVWHKSDRPFPCEICGLRYKSRAQAKSHQNTVHAGLGQVKCDLCDCTFTSAIQRKRHYFVHTGVRYTPHKCKYCTEMFDTKKKLNKHSLSFHKEFIDAVTEMSDVHTTK